MTDRELFKMVLDTLSMAVEPKKGKVYALEFQPIDCAAMHLKVIEALRARLAQPETVAQFEFQNYGWWRDEEGKLQLGTQPQGE